MFRYSHSTDEIPPAHLVGFRRAASGREGRLASREERIYPYSTPAVSTARVDQQRTTISVASAPACARTPRMRGCDTAHTRLAARIRRRSRRRPGLVIILRSGPARIEYGSWGITSSRNFSIADGVARLCCVPPWRSPSPAWRTCCLGLESMLRRTSETGHSRRSVVNCRANCRPLGSTLPPC